MGISNDYAFHKKFIPEITLDELNIMAHGWITDDNNAVMLEAPDKEGIKIPTEAEIKDIIEGVKNEKIAAYQDASTAQVLLPTNQPVAK